MTRSGTVPACGTLASYKRGCRCRSCKDANNANAQALRDKDPEKYRQRNNAYNERNREKESERARLWYAANKDRAKERIRAWNKANPDRVRKYKRDRYGREKTSGVHSRQLDFDS